MQVATPAAGALGVILPIHWKPAVSKGSWKTAGRIRRLMPRECLRLQGFEEWQIDRILAIQSDAQAYKQAGNSVTVHVIEAIARRIREVDAELKAGAAA